jgi:Ca2+-binding RTX toxin-like protein
MMRRLILLVESVALMVALAATAAFAQPNNLEGTERSEAIFGGFDVDLITGKEGHDLLVGEAGNDTILGGPGNDFLVAAYG